MTKDYSANVPDLETAILTERHHIAIGRLVRACAAIEDYITLFICRMLDLSEAKADMLLGVMPIRGRLQIAERAAATFGKDGPETYKNWLKNPALDSILNCRNALAHGILIGQTNTGSLAFRTSTKTGHEEGRIGNEIIIYDIETIEECVTVAETGVIDLPGGLKLQALLEKRRTQPLAPHPKSQPPKKRTGGISSPPQSSPR
jgi:hypothetical protein